LEVQCVLLEQLLVDLKVQTPLPRWQVKPGTRTYPRGSDLHALICRVQRTSASGSNYFFRHNISVIASRCVVWLPLGWCIMHY